MTSTHGKASSQTIRWMAWSGAGRIVLMIVGIGSVAVLARLLTQEDYGVFAAAMIFIGIVRSGLVQGGFPTAVIQRQELTPLHVRNAFTGMLAIHLAAAALIWTGSQTIAAFFDMPQLTDILKVLCITILINPILAISTALLKRRKRFRMLAATDVVSSVFAGTAVAIALAWAGFGVWSLVVSSITWALTQTAITYAVARFSLVPALTSHMRDLLRVSLGMSLVGALAVFSGQAAKFVIGRVLGADMLGVFSRANRVLDAPKDLLGSAQVLFPVMAGMNDDRERMARGYLRSIALCSLAAAPLTILFWHASEGLVLLLLGERWAAAVEPIAILSFSLIFGLNTRVMTATLMALGRVSELVVRQALFAAFIVTGSVFGSRWGIEGVCGAIVVTNVVCFLFAAHLANRHLEVAWRTFARAMLPAAMLALPVLGVLVVGKAYVWRDIQTILQFPIEAAATGIVVYLACMIKPRWFIGTDGIWLVGELRRHVPARLRRLIPGGGA